MIKPSNRSLDIQEYFFSIKMREIKGMENDGHPVCNLGIGSPDLEPHFSVVETLYKTAKKPGEHGYQPYNGKQELREGISKFLKHTFQVSMNPSSNILPLMGSKEGILHISMAFLNPGDIVLIPELGYPAYRSISQMVQARIVEYPLDDSYYPDWNQFPEEAKHAKLLWMNYPHMPTGSRATRNLFENAVRWGLENEVLLCHDNPYSLVLNEEPLSIFSVENATEIALEMHSLSKSHNMAGWRVGWVMGHEEHIKPVLKMKSNIDSGMFSGIQSAAVEALELPAAWHAERNQIYKERQQLAFELLGVLKCTFTKEQTGMFVWGKLPEGRDSHTFTEELLKRSHVFITPGTIFGEMGNGYVRISLCADTEVLTEALKRVKQ